MAVTATNFNVEPCNVFMGLREKSTITCLADVADSLDGLYFQLATAGNAAVTHHVWFNTLGGVAVDPAPGTIAIEVAITTGDSATAVALAVKTAIAAVSGFNAISSGAVLTVENNVIGTAAAAVDGNSLFTFARVAIGEEVDLGGTIGGVTVSPEVNTVAINADQHGAQLLGEISTGNNVTLAMSLAEVTAAKWALIVGDFFGGTESLTSDLVGFGESKQFTNIASYAKELVLRPVNQANNLRDINFWKAYPVPSSINFSGEDIQVMELEVRCIRDESRPASVRLFAFGDGEQAVLV